VSQTVPHKRPAQLTKTLRARSLELAGASGAGAEDPSLASSSGWWSSQAAVSEAAEQTLGQLREETSTQLKELTRAREPPAPPLPPSLTPPCRGRAPCKHYTATIKNQTSNRSSDQPAEPEMCAAEARAPACAGKHRTAADAAHRQHEQAIVELEVTAYPVLSVAVSACSVAPAGGHAFFMFD
jgi:hypothetical protein